MKTLKEMITYAHSRKGYKTCASFIVAHGFPSKKDKDTFNAIIKRALVQAKVEHALGALKQEVEKCGDLPYNANMYLNAPCFASINYNGYGTFMGRMVEIYSQCLNKEDFATVRELRKKSKRSHFIMFPKFTRQWEGVVSPAKTVYNLMCKEKWIAPHLVGGAKNFDSHLKNGCIVKIGDMTLQKAFAIGMALRVPQEHHTRVANTYPYLIKEGFPAKIAARLCLHTYYNGTHLVPMPGGHAFCVGLYVSKENWEAMFKDEWVLPWTQTTRWVDLADTGDNEFDLDRITTCNGKNVRDMEKCHWKELFKEVKDGWASRRVINMEVLKGLLNAK